MYVSSNQKGYSLMEMIVAVGVSGIISLVAASVFSFALEVFTRTVRQYEAEGEMLSAMYAIKTAFSQSVNVTYGGVTSATANDYSSRPLAATTPTAATRGRIFSTNFNATAMGSTPDTFLIAATIKEMNVAGDDSVFFGNGVYFQRSSHDKSGALYIDHEIAGTPSSPSTGWVILSPVNAPLMFTRFTEFHLENVKVVDGTGAMLDAVVGTHEGFTALSADIRMVMRYFSKGRPDDFRWCPATVSSQPANCSNGIQPVYWRDVEKKVRVVFANNAYDRNQYLAERPFGRVYFFKNWAPTARQGL